MKTLKFFILDSKVGEDLAKQIELASYILDYKLEITAPKWDHTLQSNFDGYLIHYSDTSAEAIEELRQHQPWCKIFLIVRGSSNIEYSELGNIKNIVDGKYCLVSIDNAKEMLTKTKEIYDK